MRLLCGYFANPRKELSDEGYTHDWTVFVEGKEGQNGQDIKHVVQKVIFRLHSDYKPNDKRGIYYLNRYTTYI